MKLRYGWLVLALCFVCMGARAQVTRADGRHAIIKVEKWTPAYVGIDTTTVHTDGRHASVAYVMRVDLKAPGISFMTTPHTGTKETVSETSKEFATEEHLQVAINAGFFAPCCNEKPEEKDILGLSISEGKIVSPPYVDPKNNGGDPTYHDALLITKDNVATIEKVTEATDLTKFYTAVTGSAIIETAGENTGDVNALNRAAYGNPRTVVGLSKDGRYLYMLVVDGRKPEYSFGTTNTESADIMMALGAWTSMNLDGGGSTTMVREDAAGKVVTVNRPSGLGDRLVAGSFGVHAEKLRAAKSAH
jgi:exopolysaccharide biosynthesis protein